MTCRELITFADDMEAQADEMFRCAQQLKWQAERIRQEVRNAVDGAAGGVPQLRNDKAGV